MASIGPGMGDTHEQYQKAEEGIDKTKKQEAEELAKLADKELGKDKKGGGDSSSAEGVKSGINMGADALQKVAQDIASDRTSGSQSVTQVQESGTSQGVTGAAASIAEGPEGLKAALQDPGKSAQAFSSMVTAAVTSDLSKIVDGINGAPIGAQGAHTEGSAGSRSLRGGESSGEVDPASLSSGQRGGAIQNLEHRHVVSSHLALEQIKKGTNLVQTLHDMKSQGKSSDDIKATEDQLADHIQSMVLTGIHLAGTVAASKGLQQSGPTDDPTATKASVKGMTDNADQLLKGMHTVHQEGTKALLQGSHAHHYNQAAFASGGAMLAVVKALMKSNDIASTVAQRQNAGAQKIEKMQTDISNYAKSQLDKEQGYISALQSVGQKELDASSSYQMPGILSMFVGSPGTPQYSGEAMGLQAQLSKFSSNVQMLNSKASTMSNETNTQASAASSTGSMIQTTTSIASSAVQQWGQMMKSAAQSGGQ